MVLKTAYSFGVYFGIIVSDGHTTHLKYWYALQLAKVGGSEPIIPCNLVCVRLLCHNQIDWFLYLKKHICIQTCRWH